MPSDANGVYTLPSGYLAITGETIQASQHNPPLEDIATAMSARLPVNGAAPMTGPLKLTGGTAAAPSATFASATNTGFFRSLNGIGIAVNGSQVAEFTAVSAFVPVGGIIDWPNTAAPNGWLHCQGQSLLRASFPLLFSVIGGKYGAVDANHFSLPDLRGTTTAGWDESSLRGILSGANTVGALLGSQTVTLDQTQMPIHGHPGSTSDTEPDHTHTIPNSTTVQTGTSSPATVLSGGTTNTGPGGSHSHDLNIATAGAGLSHPNVQPTTVMAKIIFAGA